MDTPGTGAGTAASRSEAPTAVLLDRQPLWLGGLETVLARHGVTTVASATTIDAALRAVEANAPTIVILDPDLTSESMTAMDLIGHLRRENSTVKIACLGSRDDAASIDATFAAGADAYFLKIFDPDEFGLAIRHLCTGLIFFAPPRPGTDNRRVEASPGELLTNRETEILRLAADGLPNKEIARRLWVTEQTVKFHLSNVYRKLHVSNRSQAGHWAHQHGLVRAS